jgi:hypothetical protein
MGPTRVTAAVPTPSHPLQILNVCGCFKESSGRLAIKNQRLRS